MQSLHYIMYSVIILCDPWSRDLEGSIIIYVHINLNLGVQTPSIYSAIVYPLYTLYMYIILLYKTLLLYYSEQQLTCAVGTSLSYIQFIYYLAIHIYVRDLVVMILLLFKQTLSYNSLTLLPPKPSNNMITRR